MSQDAQHEPLPTDATSQPAATMPEPGYHPFAEEFAQMGRGQEQGASAPDAEPAPPGSQPPDAPQTPTDEPVDFEARYKALQQQVEAEHARREAERSQFEQQQQQWLEHQRRENERQAELQRQQAEQQYKAQLKAVYERAVSADDDEKGLAALDEFVRKDIAAQLSQHFQGQLEAERQQYQQQLEQYKTEAEQYVESAFKPGFAQKLVADYGLPSTAAALIMAAPSAQMEQKAAEIQQLLAHAAPQIQQRVIEQKAQERRASGVDAVGGASGGPLPPRELQPMSADSPDAIALARALLGS